MVGENDVNCILCGRFTLHQRHDGIKTLQVTRPKSAIQKRQGLLNMARVSNAPDCTAQGLRLGPRRAHLAKRPNTGRTTARANVEGRHLLSGFVGPVRRRSAHDPRRRIHGTKGGALVREFVQSGRVQTKAGFLFSPVGTPCLKGRLRRLSRQSGIYLT